MMKIFKILLLMVFCRGMLTAQRTYTPNSVLQNGNWYKIAVRSAGIYKIDVAFLNGLGINTGNIPSQSIRLFGNGGQMLPENNQSPRPDDLLENAIQVMDGGDGIFNNNDYFLFYAPGPDARVKDSVNRRFSHQKNIYEDRSYYFISIGGNGKRIPAVINNSSPNLTVQAFDHFEFHELDTLNFLNSGKEWFGEEFANAPGKTLQRNFSLNVPGLLAGQPCYIQSEVAARSIGNGSLMELKLNGQSIQSHSLPPVNAGVYDPFVSVSRIGSQSFVNQNSIQLAFTYQPGNFNAQAWLNYFSVNARAALNLQGWSQLFFRDWGSVGPGNISKFIVQNASPAVKIWNITDPFNVSEMQASLSGTDLSFTNNSDRLYEYVAFSPANTTQPIPVGKINNQDLHNSQPLDLLIITHPSLLAEANRLANFHVAQDNLKTGVFSTDRIYNEFASGSADPVAIRDFIKMYYDKANGDSTLRPKYVLLLGDGSFDYKSRINNNNNLLPVFESANAIDPLATYTSDDFFVLLDDGDDINNNFLQNNLDAGIGRIPAANITQAKAAVDKIIAYYSAASLGPWRNYLSFSADDEDNNLHLTDAEIITNNLQPSTAVFNYSKIYLDAYKQESGSGGSRYPAANEANNNRIYNGTLIWNYNGHGGYNRLAEEVFVDQDIVNGWNNANKLPLFITATCDFAPFDNPLLNSLGENLLLREKTGAIALMSTTRPVFSFSNRVMNYNYLLFALQAKPDGQYRTLGEAIKTSKNYTFNSFGDVINTRKFMLLGDPALRLGFPQFKIRTTAVDGNSFTGQDTLKATNKYTISGEVTDLSGNLLNNFNGFVYPTLFDKPQQLTTLANDPGSIAQSFSIQSNIIYKGKVAVQNGKFNYSFIVPKDINYQVANGKISYYAENGSTDAAGYTSIKVGDIGTGAVSDTKGPDIRPYLNDESFANGGLVNEQPVLIIRLADSSGINTTGSGIGHDITAVLDNDNRKIYKLNDFFESATNSYQQGLVRFVLPVLEEGYHSLRIKAWDVLNNSNEAILDFRVEKKEELAIDHVLNYPNPFTTKTSFWFEHNQPNEDLLVTIRIMTISGRLVKTLKNILNSTGNRLSQVEWDGRDDFGNKLARGVYIYSLLVKTRSGQSKAILQKLVIL